MAKETKAALWAIVLILVGLMLGPYHASARRELVDRVMAIVGDEAVFKSDVDEGVKQLMLQRGKVSLDEDERRKAERQVLEDLIGEKLILAQAKKLGIDVPFSDVEKNVENWIKRSQEVLGGREAFERQLEVEGLTLDKLRELYRKQVKERMIIEKVMAAEVDRSRLQVSEDELRKYFAEKKAELGKRPEVVHLATIFFSFSSSREGERRARQKAEELRARILGGEDFAMLAKLNSEDPSAERGGDLGLLNPSDIRDKKLAEAASTLAPGELSEPVRTNYGYHILQVLERDSASGDVRLRHILIRIKPSEDDVAEVFQQAQAVREMLLKGTPFDSLARAVSDDTASAREGGDLGWLKVADLPRFFQDVLAGMNVGGISQVLRESSGFRVVKLIEREEEREYRYEEVKGELERMLEEEKMESVYRDYISNLKKQHYVKVLHP